ncbi:MAG TPA: hypothetical protein VEK79_09410 [Thermoanaerobaculia bacterium]|nr:hypothetical protein [Thermoanaerobaculia bacterium]
MRLFLLTLLLATLGNADIVKLVKAGLSPETIEAKIAASDVDFDTSTGALIALANEGVPDRVIRAMIESEAVAPVPPAPPRVPSSRRYDVTVHAEKGAGKCEAELRINRDGIRASRCRALDFDLVWRDVTSVCYTYGFRGEVMVKSKGRERKISMTTPAEAKRLVEHIRAIASRVAFSECP